MLLETACQTASPLSILRHNCTTTQAKPGNLCVRRQSRHNAFPMRVPGCSCQLKARPSDLLFRPSHHLSLSIHLHSLLHPCLDGRTSPTSYMRSKCAKIQESCSLPILLLCLLLVTCPNSSPFSPKPHCHCAFFSLGHDCHLSPRLALLAWVGSRSTAPNFLRNSHASSLHCYPQCWGLLLCFVCRNGFAEQGRVKSSSSAPLIYYHPFTICVFDY